MNEILKSRLLASGWRPGTFRGYLLTRRAGIEFEVGPARGGEERLTVLYRYHTETTHAEGEETLPADADLSRVYDAMTGIYLRVHERPDPSRVFGGGRKSRNPVVSPSSTPDTTPQPDPGQGTLDL
ncbi:MAG: hypothetical protein OHK0029_33670 [Armatimonadaceae bacterium]